MLGAYLLTEYKFEKTKLKEFIQRSAILTTGLLVELTFRYFQLTSYPSSNDFVPAWLLLVWLSFSFTFNGCYRWLNHYSLWIAYFLGAIFGPSTYWIASKLTPFQILEPILFTVASSLFWGALYGASIAFSKSCDRVQK